MHRRRTHSFTGIGQSAGTVQPIPPELELPLALALALPLELELELEDEVDPPAPPEPPVPVLVAAPPVPVVIMPVVWELVLVPPEPPDPPTRLRSTEEMSSHAAVVETKASTQGTRR